MHIHNIKIIYKYFLFEQQIIIKATITCAQNVQPVSSQVCGLRLSVFPPFGPSLAARYKKYLSQQLRRLYPANITWLFIFVDTVPLSIG